MEKQGVAGVGLQYGGKFERETPQEGAVGRSISLMKDLRPLNGWAEEGQTDAGLTSDQDRTELFFNAAGRQNKILGFLVLGSDEDPFAVEIPAPAQGFGLVHPIVTRGYDIGVDKGVGDAYGASLNFSRFVRFIEASAPDRPPKYHPPIAFLKVLKTRFTGSEFRKPLDKFFLAKSTTL